MTSAIRKASGFLMTALLGVMFCSMSAKASTVLFSTLGPDDDYEWGQNITPIGQYGMAGNQAKAIRFNLGANATLDDATLALINIRGGSTPASVYIEADIPDNGEYPENGGIPGSVLTTLTQVGASPYDGGLVSFTCDAQCNLGAGWYWLVITESDPHDSAQGWFLAQATDAPGIIAINQDGSHTGPWAINGNGALNAFRIDGAYTVPEPNSLALFGSGLIGVAALVRRRRSS